MQSLQDLLGIGDYTEEFEDAKAGKAPNSQWDVNLPLNLEYRLTVDTADYSKSKAGKDQIVLTWAVVEPEAYAGAKFQTYHSPNPTNTVGSQILAKLFGALQASFDGYGTDIAAFVKQFEGRTVVAALKTWGQENDRYETRWTNTDRGQTLRTDLKPPKGQSSSASDLRADVVIPKADEPSAPVVTPPVITPPVVSPPGGVNLPPGLRG